MKGIVTLDQVRFYARDLAGRYKQPEYFPYVMPVSVEHFSTQIIEQLEKHAKVEADDVLVLETNCAIDVQLPEAWRMAASFNTVSELIRLYYGVDAVRRFRKVPRDERPDPGLLWFVEDLDGDRIVVRRWKAGHMDSSD